MDKRKILYYCLIYEKQGKLEKQCFTSIEKVINNAKFLVQCGFCVQISRMEVDVECSNVWKQC